MYILTLQKAEMTIITINKKAKQKQKECQSNKFESRKVMVFNAKG